MWSLGFLRKLVKFRGKWGKKRNEDDNRRGNVKIGRKVELGEGIG